MNEESTISEFDSLLSTMDLVIALRFPTMGEVSAIVMKSMICGIPVIVSDNGWYRELPSFVDKLPTKNTNDALYKLMAQYLDNPDLLKKKREIFTEYAQKEFDYNHEVAKYIQIINNFYNKKLHKLKAVIQIENVINQLDHTLDHSSAIASVTDLIWLTTNETLS